MLLEEVTQDLDGVAEQDRAELAVGVAQVHVAGSVRGRPAGLSLRRNACWTSSSPTALARVPSRLSLTSV